MRTSLSRSPSEAEVDALIASLEAYNRRYLDDDEQRFAVVVRTHDGSVVGGLDGVTRWGRALVQVIWVDEEARGCGVGSKLLAEAEDIARERGCRAIDLDTMSFQAPAFYEKNGYRQFGRLEGYPGGHSCHFFTKDLVQGPR